VPTEDLKVKKFERGLQPRIMNQVVGFEIGNLMDLASKAEVIERTLKINAEYFNQKKRKSVWGTPLPPQQEKSQPNRWNKHSSSIAKLAGTRRSTSHVSNS
jgi:hypothetical protein